MKFSCDQCNAQYMIADEKVGGRGVKVKCKKCGHIIVVKPGAEPEEQASFSASEAAAAPPPSDLGPSQAGGTDGESFGEFPASAPPSPNADDEWRPDSFGESAPSDPFGSAGSSSFEPPSDTAASTAASDTEGGEAAWPPSDDPFASDSAPEEPTPGTVAPQQFETPAGDGAGSSDFGFGLDGTLGASPDLGALSAEQEAASPEDGETSAPSSRPPGEKEWYVAVDESQIGPVDIAEIERRWDVGELDEETLAWKAGMQDWLPIADVGELAYLVTERPQKKAGVAAGSALASAAVGGAAAGGAASGGSSASLGPVSFDAPADGQGEAGWAPSAASALSSLVEDELTAPKEEAAQEQGPEADDAASLGMPSFGAADLFGGGGGGDAPPAAPADPFAGGVPAWSAPKPSSSSGLKPIHLVLAGAGTSIVAAAVVVVVLMAPWQQNQNSAAQGPVAAQQAGQPSEGAAAAEEDDKKGDDKKEAARAAKEDDGKAEKEEAKPAEEKEPKVAKASTSSSSSSSSSRKTTSSSSGRSTNRSSSTRGSRTTRSSRSGGKDKLDDVFNTPNVKENLTRDDIMNGVKKNMSNVMDCLKAARAKGELSPGRYTLVLDWKINPNGTVSAARLKGPGNVMGTSLPSCFAAKMRRWKFPPSKKGAPITNFPFGPFTIK